MSYILIKKKDRGQLQASFVPFYPDWKCFTSSYPIVTWEMSKRPFSNSYESFTLSRKSLSVWCIPSRAQYYPHPLLILEQTKKPFSDNAWAGFLLEEFTKYWWSTTSRDAIKIVMFVTSLIISTSDRLFTFSLIFWGMEVYGFNGGGKQQDVFCRVEDHTKVGTSEKIKRTLHMHLEPYKSMRKGIQRCKHKEVDKKFSKTFVFSYRTWFDAEKKREGQRLF